MQKSDAFILLNTEGWTKEDAKRALSEVDFSNDPDELTILKAASSFAGKELLQRQRLQAAQKSLVTKKDKEIEKYKEKIDRVDSETDLTKLLTENRQLQKINEELKRDNKRLKNIVDMIKLKLAQQTKEILQYEDSEIRKAVIKIFKSTLG
jgi:predicted RNase H-like nuclease (RuvC/YqgF family)